MQKRLLQITIALGACVPVTAGLLGIFQGTQMVGNVTAFQDANNHFAYLSGLLLAIGLLFWASIPQIERHTARVQLLTVIVLTGGLARLYDALAHGMPGLAMQAALAMELVVTPLLCLWQRRVARQLE